MESKTYTKDPNLSLIINNLLQCCVEIRDVLANTPVKKLTSHNKFGDQQLELDVTCDNLVEKYCRESKHVAGIINEERPQYLELGPGDYIVTYDPLDGSSIIDTNFAMGTIVAIWKKDQKKLVGTKVGNGLVNAMLVVYGPRLTCILYNQKEDAVQELTYLHGKWQTTEKNCTIAETCKIFSPGNLRSAQENREYHDTVSKLIDRGLTLRYTGGLVPDAHQIFIKGNGLFLNLGSPIHKVKLRVLYEVAATCFLIEKAGGKSVCRGHLGSAMDHIIETYDDKLEFACGSSKEIDIVAPIFK